MVRVTVIMGVLSPAHAAAQDEAPRASPWRAELQLHGAWVPGGYELQHGRGIGLAARFHGFEAGPELWWYRLALEDELEGERHAYHATMFVPLRVGYQHRFSDLSIVVGVAASVGAVTGGYLETATCTDTHYTGWVPGLRGFVGLDLGYGMVGPYVGYQRGPKAIPEGCDRLVRPPDPKRRIYPSRLPLELQLGLSVILAYP
ncbi:MAG: hypothetical protein KIT72_05325 [Polyangiaceae bacterium]|nr:hypothetical protein [Polyangiaceae bacterium]MCW5789819.1 hypothetical protein [Polyangiaceae bacterium]